MMSGSRGIFHTIAIRLLRTKVLSQSSKTLITQLTCVPIRRKVALDKRVRFCLTFTVKETTKALQSLILCDSEGFSFGQKVVAFFWFDLIFLLNPPTAAYAASLPEAVVSAPVGRRNLHPSLFWVGEA